MVVAQKLYPRGTVKRIVKAHAGCNVSKNADVLAHARGFNSVKKVGRATDFGEECSESNREYASKNERMIDYGGICVFA
ncbi:hypothetical protein VTN49DRAFT_7993 [Thermomyces lanuginosus]|uniref:uncharacterized protein n=1 Tax=Thermomyces lanuginosus TaxID=5541 RepID=UPI003743CC65